MQQCGLNWNGAIACLQQTNGDIQQILVARVCELNFDQVFQLFTLTLIDALFLLLIVEPRPDSTRNVAIVTGQVGVFAV
jgi:hypothetical protein